MGRMEPVWLWLQSKLCEVSGWQHHIFLSQNDQQIEEPYVVLEGPLRLTNRVYSYL